MATGVPDAAVSLPSGATALWAVLKRIDFNGEAGMAVPASRDALRAAIEAGAPALPRPYQDGYVTPVLNGLATLLALAADGRIHDSSVETVAGAIYQHGPGLPLARPLRRFTAVISDLYRSFLADARRSGADIPLRETLPPLAMFQHKGDVGPITIAVDLIAQVLNGQVGVVSLPATFADHPLLWAALAHETGGHDVTHADPGLLDALAAGLGGVLQGLPNAAALVRLWSYWIDEASADVYGLLNVGPRFADNLALFLAAMGGGEAPALRTNSAWEAGDATQTLDPHPTDILRLHLLLGAIDSLAGLAPGVRQAHLNRVAGLAFGLAAGDSVAIGGNVAATGAAPEMLTITASLGAMAAAARKVGHYIATAQLAPLGGRSIQFLETWDDADESIADAIAGALVAGGNVALMGDAAQLLAGATAAALARPDLYDAITAALNAALDACFLADPIWSVPQPDRLYIRYS